MSPEVAVHRADLIATGRVLQISEPRWTTPDGNPPAILDNGLPASIDVEYRVATVRIDQTIMGDAPAEITIGMPGDGSGISEDVWSNWTEGDELLVYLTPAATIPGWRLSGSDYGIQHGTTIEDGIAKGHPELGLDEGDIPVSQVVARVQAELTKSGTGSN